MQRGKRLTCRSASWTFFQLVRHWKYDGTLAPDETASVNSNNRFIVYPGEADARSLSCAPPSGRCLPVHYATLDGRPIAPANLGYITTGRTVQLQVIRAHLQYRNGPPTKDGLDLTHPRTTPVNIGELTLTVRYPMRASFTDVVACLDTADQTFYIDSGVYRPTKNAEDQSRRETNLYIRVCRDTADSDPVELIQFFPRQGYYQYGDDDLRYTDDDRVRHFQNFVADACHATDVAYPSRTEGALLSSDCWSKRVHGGSVGGRVGNCVVILPAQPVTPDGGAWETQLLAPPGSSPSSHCDVEASRVVATDELERRSQVTIGGHDHADVVGTADGQRHEVDCQGDVDALLLGRLCWPTCRVSKGAGDHRRSGCLPAAGLPSMRRIGARVPAPVRAAGIDPHSFQGTGGSVWPASGCDELAKLHRVELAILARLSIGIKASAGPAVRILDVDEQGEPQGRRHEPALLRRQK